MEYPKTFQGYPRKNGPAGIRNIVLVISGDLCCNPWSREIAGPFDNCYALMHKHGVGNYAPDRILFKTLISGIAVHPNVSGIVFVYSGNEDHTPEELLAPARRAEIPVYVVSVKIHPAPRSSAKGRSMPAGCPLNRCERNGRSSVSTCCVSD